MAGVFEFDAELRTATGKGDARRAAGLVRFGDRLRVV